MLLELILSKNKCNVIALVSPEQCLKYEKCKKKEREKERSKDGALAHIYHPLKMYNVVGFIDIEKWKQMETSQRKVILTCLE